MWQCNNTNLPKIMHYWIFFKVKIMFFQLRGGYPWQRWLCLLTYVNTILVNCFALQHIFPLANRNVIFLVHLSCCFAQSARCGKCQTIQNFTRHCCVIQISVSRFHKKFPSTFCNVTITIIIIIIIIIIIDLSVKVPLRYSYTIYP